MSSALPLPLPQVQGPKLAPFNGTAHADIEFIRPIGSSEDRDSYVWEVEIDAKKYTLKMASLLGRLIYHPNCARMANGQFLCSLSFTVGRAWRQTWYLP